MRACRQPGLDHVDVPVIEGVAAAVKQAEVLVGVVACSSKVEVHALPLPRPYIGLFTLYAPSWI